MEPLGHEGLGRLLKLEDDLQTPHVVFSHSDLEESKDLESGGIIKIGKKVAILNFGARMKECLLACENLSKKGINPTLIDARFAKPLDENLIWQAATDHEAIITIEEGSIGGFGSQVGHF